MSVQVNIYEAKTRLSQLVDQAVDGEDVIIARNGTPVARLVPIQRKATPASPTTCRSSRLADSALA